MTILQSEIAVGSEQYQQNRDALLTKLQKCVPYSKKY
jgi:hypothetical protein